MKCIQAVVVFGAMLAINAITKEDNGSCLLQKSSAVTKTSSQGLMAPDTHRNWRSEHQLLLADTTEEMDTLGKFISMQTKSGDACSARLMESKRVLDGLLKDLKDLSTQVDGHEEVLETETGNLNITELSVKAVGTAYEEAMAVCEQEKQDAADEVSQYQSELAELDQIAKPSVRMSHVVKANVSEGVGTESSIEAGSLLQQDSWSKDSCVAFLEFQKKHKKYKQKQDPEENEENKDTLETETNCDTQRKELQKEFREAYIEIRSLLKESQENVQDTTCVDTANARKAAELVPLVSAREHASSLIESSTNAIAALDPLLDLVDMRVEKLSKHIYNDLTPECAEAKEVSEALQKIRELILLLEECPGRNDFRLKIPKEEPLSEEEVAADDSS